MYWQYERDALFDTLLEQLQRGNKPRLALDAHSLEDIGGATVKSSAERKTPRRFQRGVLCLLGRNASVAFFELGVDHVVLLLAFSPPLAAAGCRRAPRRRPAAPAPSYAF